MQGIISKFGLPSESHQLYANKYMNEKSEDPSIPPFAKSDLAYGRDIWSPANNTKLNSMDKVKRSRTRLGL